MLSEAPAPTARPRFSIVLPAYNVERYIARCLRSLSSQTFPADEILVYDDGSTDRTAAVVARFASKNPSIRLIRQENTGQGAIRNRGVREATGDYLLFVDSDDELDRRTLERCAVVIDSGPVDFVTFRYQLRYPVGVRGYQSQWADGVAGRGELVGVDTELLLTNRWLAPWQSAYRLAFVRAHELRNGEGYIFEDQEFTAGAIIAADRVGLIDAPLYQYHFNASSSLREKSAAALRRRIDGRRHSRSAIVTQLDRHDATPRARAILADHDLHDFVQEVVLGIYTDAERDEVLADIAAFLNGLAPVDVEHLTPAVAHWFALEPAARDAGTLAEVVRALAATERRRVAQSLAFRLARRVVRAEGPNGRTDELVDERFAAVFGSFPHRMLRRVGTAAGPTVRVLRRVIGPHR